MDKIKKYVGNFKKHNKVNKHYIMRGSEVCEAMKGVREDAFRTITSIFEFGYAKGYRAAMAEMKKKGGVTA